MSILNRFEDWLIRQTMTLPLETHPVYPEKSDELPVLLTLLVLVLLFIAITCGQYIGK
jgi:hypothetical protein